jgi:hypothetical protein
MGISGMEDIDVTPLQRSGRRRQLRRWVGPFGMGVSTSAMVIIWTSQGSSEINQGRENE